MERREESKGKPCKDIETGKVEQKAIDRTESQRVRSNWGKTEKRWQRNSRTTEGVKSSPAGVARKQSLENRGSIVKKKKK